MIKKYFIFLFLCLITLNIKAQDPNWSINTANYQYSMTFTAFLNINGTTLSSTNDKVAAFINGEVRGVSNVVYVASLNKYLTYLSVYANTNNETISFKIYDNTNDIVIDIDRSQNFIIDGNVGGVFQSYSIASPTLSKDAVLNFFGFSGVTPVSQIINNNTIDIVLPANTDVTNLIAEYTISDGATFFIGTTKQISGTSTNDFTNTIKYKLLSENEAVLVVYEVNITLENANVNTPEIELIANINAEVKQVPIVITMKTNVAILDFVADDILLTNGVVSSIKKENDLLYTLEIVPIQQGEFSIEIPENKVINIENEGNLASNKLIFRYDIVNPYLLSIKRKNPINEITKSDVLEFTVVFSEEVDNVFSTDFKSVDNATFTVEKENNSTFKVIVENIEYFIGAVSLSINPINNIQDKAGNLLVNSVINVHQN